MSSKAIERIRSMVPADWGLPQLRDVSTVCFSNVDKKWHPKEEPVRLCNYVDVYYNDNITNDLSFMRATATEREINKFHLLKGDVVITKDSEAADDIAVPTYVSEELDSVVCGYHLAIIRPNRKKLLGEFLTSLLKLHAMRYYFYTLANGVTRFGLTMDVTLSARVPLPPIEEQETIAAMLSTLGRMIRFVEYILDQKKRFKKGIIQGLMRPTDRHFSEVHLGDFLSPVTRPVPKPNHGYQALGLRSHGKGTFRKVVDEPNKVMMDKLYEVRRDDLIVNITFAWEGAIALVGADDEGCLVSHRFPTFRIDSNVIMPGYLRNLILTKRFVYDLGVISPGGAGRNRVLSKKDFLRLSVFIPSIDWQKKITALLNEIDKDYNYISLLRDRLKRLKIGLMQALLTGQVRVKVAGHNRSAQ